MLDSLLDQHYPPTGTIPGNISSVSNLWQEFNASKSRFAETGYEQVQPGSNFSDFSRKIGFRLHFFSCRFQTFAYYFRFILVAVAWFVIRFGLLPEGLLPSPVLLLGSAKLFFFTAFVVFVPVEPLFVTDEAFVFFIFTSSPSSLFLASTKVKWMYTFTLNI